MTQVEAWSDAPALIGPNGNTISYADLARNSAARAKDMHERGVGVGDVVLIARGVSPALYETLLAVFRLGATALFPEPAAGIAGLRHAVQATQPKVMAAGALGRAIRLVHPWLRELPLAGHRVVDHGDDAPVARVGEHTPALITFTSGSTGRPKGVMRTIGFLMLQHRLIEHVRQTSPGDVDLISLPVFVLSNLAAGAATVLPNGPISRPARLSGPKMRDQIESHSVRRIIASPIVCERLASLGPNSLDAVEAIFTGGGPVFPNLLRLLRQAAPNARIYAAYGSTEAEPIAHIEYDQISEGDWSAMAEGAGLLAGVPISEAEVEIVDDEVWVSGPHVNEGYLDPADDAETKVRRGEQIWHRTGDAARMDGQGRLWLLGRHSAGDNGRYPFAFEAAAHAWPGVEQAAALIDGQRTRLVVAGAKFSLAEIRARAAALGDVDIVPMARIPMDARHNSKVNYALLSKRLSRLASD